MHYQSNCCVIHSLSVISASGSSQQRRRHINNIHATQQKHTSSDGACQQQQQQQQQQRQQRQQHHCYLAKVTTPSQLLPLAAVIIDEAHQHKQPTRQKHTSTISYHITAYYCDLRVVVPMHLQMRTGSIVQRLCHARDLAAA